MITFNVVTTYSDSLFDTLYNACSADMDAGSYPWHIFPQITTVEQKKAHLQAGFDAAPFMFTVDEDGHYLMLNAGSVTNGVFSWYLGLIGPNTSGSKSWLYGDDYVNARNAFWPANSITNINIETAGGGTALYDHLESAKQAGTIPFTVYEDVTLDKVLITENEVRYEL